MFLLLTQARAPKPGSAATTLIPRPPLSRAIAWSLAVFVAASHYPERRGTTLTAWCIWKHLKGRGLGVAGNLPSELLRERRKGTPVVPNGSQQSLAEGPLVPFW